MRLDKYLADCAIGTRSQVKKIIKDGRVEVNGNVVKDSGLILNPDSDQIILDGEILSYSQFEYYMLNKPQGLISQSKKNSLKRGDKALLLEEEGDSVVDLITTSGKIDLFPCGRLDKDTEGLLLITNDGQLSHMLLSPKHHVDKTYYVELDGKLANSDITRLEKGLDIGDDKPTLPAIVNRLSDTSVNITITEGRYHQVKRMFEAVGLTVTFLKRISFGPLTLDSNLLPGDYRELTDEELNLLKECAYK